jgi:hypothetical protein
MGTQGEQEPLVDEVNDHLLDADSVLGVRVIRDAEPGEQALRLAQDVRGEIVADLDHAQRAFAARADAGRVEPVVLKTDERAALEQRAKESNGADAADPEATIAEMHQAVAWSANDDEPGAHPELFDERALEHNRRATAVSMGVAVPFVAGALALVLTGLPVFVAVVVFVVGLVVAVSLARRIRMHLREEGGFDDVPELTGDDELEGLCDSVETPEDASRRLQAAEAWADACATIDRPMVLVEPAAWLSDNELEAMLNSLPAGAEVTIVEPG